MTVDQEMIMALATGHDDAVIRLRAAEETIARLTEALAASEARVAALEAAVVRCSDACDPECAGCGAYYPAQDGIRDGGTSALEAHVACEIKPLAIRIAELEVALIELVQPNPKNDAVIRGIEALGGEQPAHIAYVAHEIREMENAVESALESAIRGDEEMPEAAGCWAIGQSVFNRIHDTLDQRVARAVEVATKPLVELLREAVGHVDHISESSLHSGCPAFHLRPFDGSDADECTCGVTDLVAKIDAAIAGAKGG